MTDLEIERAIAEMGAALDAKPASRAERLVDVVLEIRIFDERADDRAGRTELVLSRLVEARGIGLEIAEAELAVAAHRVAVHAFDGRRIQHALGLAAAALYACARIDLPHHAVGSRPLRRFGCERRHSRTRGKTRQ